MLCHLHAFTGLISLCLWWVSSIQTWPGQTTQSPAASPRIQLAPRLAGKIWNDYDIWMWFMDNHWMMIVGKIGKLEKIMRLDSSNFMIFPIFLWNLDEIWKKNTKKTSIFSKRPTECRAKVHGLTGLTMSPGGSICRPLPAGDWEDEGCSHTLGRAEAGWWRFLPWLACG